jgi:hypothetical protein
MSQIMRYADGTIAPDIETLTGNSGGPVGPTGNNINLLGGNHITATGNPGTSTITFDLDADIAEQYDADSGSAIPALGILNILGGTGITTSASGDTVTIDGTEFPWTEITVTGPTALAVNNGYVTNNVALVQVTLPAIAAFGDIIRVEGKGAGLFEIAVAAGQSIRIGNATTTVTTGTLTATDAGDGVGLLCITANTVWMVTEGTGTINWT